MSIGVVLRVSIGVVLRVSIGVVLGVSVGVVLGVSVGIVFRVSVGIAALSCLAILIGDLLLGGLLDDFRSLLGNRAGIGMRTLLTQHEQI